jgi:NTE family protein
LLGVQIDGESYWEAGIYSNTPLDIVLTADGPINTLIFLVELSKHHAPSPRSMIEVMARHKDINYEN